MTSLVSSFHYGEMGTKDVHCISFFDHVRKSCLKDTTRSFDRRKQEEELATEIEQMDEESQLVADQVKKLKTKVKYSETLLTKVTTKLWGDVESSAIMGKLLDGDNYIENSLPNSNAYAGLV